MTVQRKVFCAITLLVGITISSKSNGQNQTIADSLVKVFNNDPEDSLKNEILHGIAMYHTDQDSTIYYANQLIERALLYSNYLYVFKGYLNLGHAQNKKGDLELALSSFFLAEDYARKSNDQFNIGTIYVAIADLYGTNSNHHNSVEYYNKAIKILRASAESVTLAVALLNAGNEYLGADELDTALVYFQESGEIFKKNNYEIGNAYNLGSVGVVYAKQGKHKLAEENIKAATSVLERLNDKYAIATFSTALAEVYQEKKNSPKALEYAHQSLLLGEEEGLMPAIRDASLMLSELYASINNFKNAYNFQSQYITYRDSINNEEVIQNLADLRTEHEVSKKQIEVDLLEQQKRTQQLVGYTMLSVLLLIIILVIVLYRTSRQKQFSNELLAMQKATVESQRDELEGLNITKDRFFSIISHDLRGPVNAFAGVAELIRCYVKDKAYDELVEVTEHIDQSSSQLSALLDNLLNWAVSQQGEFPYAPEQVNVSDMTTELEGVYQNMSSAKNVELIFDVPNEVIAFVDRNSTMTILRNLVGNALKFTESEGTITLNANTEGVQTIIKVQDTGVGIPAEKLSTLFQLHEKKSTWGTEGEKGLGLGLQLAFEFAEMNKGSIVVSSEIGVGTTFTVTLPTTQY